MSKITLYEHQRKALEKMHDGCILCGGVGSGKSRTALAYYYISQGGKTDTDDEVRMKQRPLDLYIITTAQKRDTLEWEHEMAPFLLSTHDDCNGYANTVRVDSWNNIKKYVKVKDAFFIFDEQHVKGYGAWSKTFLKIVKENRWILLSATPGDKWEDYIPVFIANGFYKNKRDFDDQHIVLNPYVKFRQVYKYLNTGRLIRCRNRVLIKMDFERKTVVHHEDVYVSYDKALYKDICRTRWDIWQNKPFKNAAQYCQALRRVVTSDISRQIALLEIFENHPKIIVFYNYDYELDILRELGWGDGVKVAEWNGHKHQPIPTGESWVYLVNYNAGAEGWNCVTTDTIVFYSQNYSYSVMVQTAGRIDRLNTPFRDLYYYHLKSQSGIDLAISQALKNKKEFNEGKFYNQAIA